MDADDELVDSIPNPGAPLETDGAAKKRKLADSDDDLVAGIDKKGKSDGQAGADEEDADGDSDSDEEGEDAMNSSDDDDDSEAENQYEEDGFVTFQEGESDDDAPKERRQKVELKRLKKNTGKIILDEEDLDIVRENLGEFATEAESVRKPINARRSEASSSKGRRGEDGSDRGEEDGSGDEIAPESGGAGGDPNDDYGGEDEEADEMKGFIVDYASDEDSAGEGGGEGGEGRARDEQQRPRQAAAPRRAAGRSHFSGPGAEAIQESVDIFGMENIDDLDIDDEDDGLEDAAGARQGEAAAKPDALLGIERQVLVDNFYTEKDESLRAVDMPERYYDQMLGREMPDAAERREEAIWIVSKLGEKIYLSHDKYRTTSLSVLQDALVGPVDFVLLCIQQEKLEIPFIWAHRRDYLHESLTRDLLWEILSLDEAWDRLFALRGRVHQVIDGVYNAFEYNSPEYIQDQQMRRSEILTLTGLRTEQEKLVLTYTESMKQALDTIDNNEDDQEVEAEREKVGELRKKISDLELELPQTLQLLTQKQREQENQATLSLQLDQYTAAGISEVKDSFPRGRYEAIIDTCTDDQELKDVRAFLALLLKGSVKDRAPAAAKHARTATVTPDAQLSNGSGDGSMMDADTQPEQVIALDEAGDEAAAAELNSTRAPAKRRAQFHDRLYQYARYRKVDGIREAIQRLFLSAADMGDAVRHGFSSTDFPNTPAGGAREYANLLSDLVDGMVLRNESDVSRAMTTIIATELSFEPSVRRAVRHKYREVTTISTLPTAKGLLTITPFSEYFGLHFLRNKPVAHFFRGGEKTLFVKLVQAEKEGLIHVAFNHPVTNEVTGEPDLQPYVRDLDFHSKWFPQHPAAEYDDYPEMRKLIDLLRWEALQMALKGMLVDLETEVRRDLLRIGKESIIEEAGRAFAELLDIGPYKPRVLEPRDAIASMLIMCPYRPFYATVVSIHVSSARDAPLCVAYIDKEGVLCASDLLPAKAANKKDEFLEKFISLHRPDLVIVNSSGGVATKSTVGNLERRILPKIKEAHRAARQAKKDEQGEDYDDFNDEGEYNPDCMVIKDDISEIFKQSDRSRKIFPDFQPGLRAAICLGRYVQEPLAEYCNLWTSASASGVFGYEALFLKLHPLLSLTKSVRGQLLLTLERALVGAVCDVGVDINAVNQHEHLAAMLAFVGGLGLRKANALRASIREKLRFVSSRAELFERKILKENVWKNAASFIRVPDVERGSVEVNPFDNTRIHPECYHNHEWAPKICANAMDNEDWVDGQDYYNIVLDVKRNSRDRLEKLVVEGKRPGGRSKAYLDMWMNGRPVLGVTTYRENILTAQGATEERTRQCEINDKLSNLLLEEYCTALEEKQEGRHKLQFDQIKEELRFPWLDLRKPMAPPSTSEMFTITTGESDTSLYVGLKMGVEVLEFDEKLVYDARSGESRSRPRAFLKTDCGLKGVITMYELSDEHVNENNFNIQDFLQVGQRLMAVVVGVDKGRHSLDMSIKPQYLKVEEDWWIANRFQNRQLQRWFEFTRAKPVRDLTKLYISHFLESDALKEYRNSLQVDQSAATASLDMQRPKARVANQRHIMHPLFVNCGHHEAEERLLANLNEGTVKYDGNVIIRPSSKGPDSLSITWAFNLPGRSFMHFDVEERGKAAGSLGLGSQLYIKYANLTEPFSDLDEIYIRFIDPMNDYAQLMSVHKSFRPDSTEAVESAMREDHLNDGNKVPYYIRYEPNMPGVYVLTWLSARSSNPIKKAKIVLLPTGYLMEKRMFTRPADIIKFLSDQVNKSSTGQSGNSSVLTAASGSSSRRVATRFTNR